MSHQHPEHWQSPQWHPDYGDAGIELDQLRSFAIKLLSAVPTARVALEIPEPGLMYVRVESASGIVAEVYSVPDIHKEGPRRLAIFLLPDTAGEIELYTEDTGGAARLFALLSVFK